MPEKLAAGKKWQEIYAPKNVRIPARLGGGILKELVVRELPSRRVIHYALAYINPLVCSMDNGRVLGYDNRHGFPHRHWMGAMRPESFSSYEDLYDRFQDEWMAIALKFVNGEPL